MTKTSIIVFSKDRTLQLKSLLRSISYYSDILFEEVSVIYKTRPEISYEPIISEFQCNFVLQEYFFDDVEAIVANSTGDYIFFMVDDLIFREEFSLRRIENFLDQSGDIDCFSLRLGRNIQDGKEPEFSRRDTDILVWDTDEDLGSNWKYFWELSSSIYRRQHVCEYLRKCNRSEVTYPNPFESHYYGSMPFHLGMGSGLRRIIREIRFLNRRKTRRMACFEKSKAFTQGVNQVTERTAGYGTLFETEELHKKMEEGFVIDFRSLRHVKNTKPNAGSGYFRLIKEEQDEGQSKRQ